MGARPRQIARLEHGGMPTPPPVRRVPRAQDLQRRFPEEVKPEVVEPKIEVRKILKIDFDVDRGVTSYIVLRVSNHKKTITAKTLVKSESGRAAIVAFHKKHRAWMTMPAARNRQALKKACMSRWNMAAEYAPRPAAMIM